MRIQAFGFKEELMLCFRGKFDDFVLDGRTIPGSYAFNLAGIHGRSADIFADNPQRLRRGEGNMTADLRLNDLLRTKTERGWGGIARLFVECVPANGPSIEA